MTAVSAEPARAMAKKFPWHLVLGEGSSFWYWGKAPALLVQSVSSGYTRPVSGRSTLNDSTVPGRWLWASN